MNIERKGKTDGRWPNYNLIVNGVDVGNVKRTISRGYDRLAGSAIGDGWKISGTICESKESAERQLIERAIRFGHIAA